MAIERVEPGDDLVQAWMGRPGRADRLVWGADPGPVRPAGSAVYPVADWTSAEAAESDAAVRLRTDRVECSWAGEEAVLFVVDEVEGLERGLARVAVWASQARVPIRTRVVWLVTWLVEVSPDGSYRKIRPPVAAAKRASTEPDHVRAASTVTTRGM